MMRVKVCGVTRLEDALLAVDLGAWALGFNFYKKSPRYIDPKQAAHIIKKLPAYIKTFGIFVNESLENVELIQLQSGVEFIQLHGDESPEYCKQITFSYVKAIRTNENLDLKPLLQYSDAYAFLLDAIDPQHYGGTGKLANWILAQCLSRQVTLILAGGLNAHNVLSAIDTVFPFAVDVCSGVEEKPGLKSKEKLIDFFDEVMK